MLVKPIAILVLAYATFVILHPSIWPDETFQNMWVESAGEGSVIVAKGPLTGQTVEEVASAMRDALESIGVEESRSRQRSCLEREEFGF